MGFISKLFGGNKEDKALREAFEQIRRIIEDEQFQLDMIHPVMKKRLSLALPMIKIRMAPVPLGLPRPTRFL